MLDIFGKKRRKAEQQRIFDQVMQAQEEVMALYEQARPVSLVDELKVVAASFEKGRRDDPAEPRCKAADACS